MSTAVLIDSRVDRVFLARLDVTVLIRLRERKRKSRAGYGVRRAGVAVSRADRDVGLCKIDPVRSGGCKSMS